MSLAPKKPQPVAAPPPEPTQGADTLKIGGGDPALNRTRGGIGRLALRVPVKPAMRG